MRAIALSRTFVWKGSAVTTTDIEATITAMTKLCCRKASPLDMMVLADLLEEQGRPEHHAWRYLGRNERKPYRRQSPARSSWTNSWVWFNWPRQIVFASAIDDRRRVVRPTTASVPILQDGLHRVATGWRAHESNGSIESVAWRTKQGAILNMVDLLTYAFEHGQLSSLGGPLPWMNRRGTWVQITKEEADAAEAG